MEKDIPKRELVQLLFIAFKIEFKAKTTQVGEGIKFKDVCWQTDVRSVVLLPWKKAKVEEMREEMQERRGHSNSTERLELIPLPFSFLLPYELLRPG